MQKKRAWLEYSEAREVFQEKKITFENIVKELKVAEKAIEPTKRQLLDTQEQLKEKEIEQNATSKVLEREKKASSGVIRKISALQNEVKDVDIQLENLKETELERKRKIQSLKLELQTIQDKLLHPPTSNSDDIDAQFQELYLRKNTIEDSLDALKLRKSEINDQSNHFNRIINQRTQQLAELNSTRNKKLEFLRRFEIDTFKALEWLGDNRHLFKGAVFEPVCMELDVKYPQYAHIIESSLSRQALTSFVFEDSEDYDIFLTVIADTQKLQVNAIQVQGGGDLSQYVPQEPLEKLRKYGFEHYFLDVVQAPSHVLAALCDNFKVHLLPISLKPVQFARVDQETTLKKYFSAGNSYEVHRERDRVTAVLSKPLKVSKFFGAGDSNVSEEQKSTLIQDLENSRASLKSNEQKMRSMLEDERVAHDHLSRVESNHKELTLAKAAIRKQYSDYQSLQRLQHQKSEELERYSTQKSLQERQKDLVKSKMTLYAKIPPLFVEHSNLVKEYFESMQKLVKISLKNFHSLDKIQKIKSSISDLEESLEKFRMDFIRGNTTCE